VLLGVEGDAVRLRVDREPDRQDTVLLRFEDIDAAKLVLTEDLIAESLRRGKSAERAARRDRRAKNAHPSRHQEDRRTSATPGAATQPEGE
jgi:ribosome maturation factor RimP